MWPFRRKPRPVAPNDWDMSRPLLPLSRLSTWLLMHAFNGTFICGETGGGKSSGSGFALAMAFLRAGFGGLVLCVKPGERQTWERYARLGGREKDLVIFDAESKKIYTSNGFDGTLVIIDQINADTYKLSEATTTISSSA